MPRKLERSSRFRKTGIQEKKGLRDRTKSRSYGPHLGCRSLNLLNLLQRPVSE